jgi:hypothetical protein
MNNRNPTKYLRKLCVVPYGTGAFVSTLPGTAVRGCHMTPLRGCPFSYSHSIAGENPFCTQTIEVPRHLEPTTATPKLLEAASELLFVNTDPADCSGSERLNSQTFRPVPSQGSKTCLGYTDPSFEIRRGSLDQSLSRRRHHHGLRQKS